MKRHVVVGGLMLLASASKAADSGYGKVNITGVVIDAPCSLAPGGDIIEVNLGAISSAELQNGHASTPVDFHFNLIGCSTTLKNQVRVTFQGTAFSDGLFSVGANNSTVGIELRDHNGRKILNNQPISWQRLYSGENQLNFSSVLRGRAATVSSGTFQAQVLFSIEYL